MIPKSLFCFTAIEQRFGSPRSPPAPRGTGPVGIERWLPDLVAKPISTGTGPAGLEFAA